MLPALASESHVPITKKPFLAYTAFGETFWFEGGDFTANAEDYNFAVTFSGLVEGLLEQGKIKTHPMKLGVGLEHVLEGLNEMRRGRGRSWFIGSKLPRGGDEGRGEQGYPCLIYFAHGCDSPRCG